MKGQCSFGEACASKYDPKKKGSGKGRLHSRFPTGSPHRNSKGDGKGGDDGNAKGTPTCSGKSASRKANGVPCASFNQGSCQREVQ